MDFVTPEGVPIASIVDAFNDAFSRYEVPVDMRSIKNLVDGNGALSALCMSSRQNTPRDGDEAERASHIL